MLAPNGLQPARGWCDTVPQCHSATVPQCHSATVGGTAGGNTVQIVSTYPASPEARPPSFFGEASRASPQHGWRSAYSLRETLSPTQDTGPLNVSRESGAPADQVEETPGRASLEKLGCRTPPQLHPGGVGRQQQQQSRVLQPDVFPRVKHMRGEQYQTVLNISSRYSREICYT